MAFPRCFYICQSVILLELGIKIYFERKFILVISCPQEGSNISYMNGKYMSKITIDTNLAHKIQ